MRRTISIVAATLVVAGLVFSMTPAGTAFFNNWGYAVQKADDATNYETLKEVEDTCRAMIVSYESDKLMYEQYKDSADSEEQTWAQQAKMRANKTAVSYNSYILKNNYVWKDAVPTDIKSELATIE